jgi:pimeloyl-ACP methyl ester carboxylesterase
MEFWVAFVIVFCVLVVVGIYVVYDICFSNNKRYMDDDDCLPRGEQYEPYHEEIRRGVELVRAERYEPVSVMSRDGLKLAGKYYHFKDNAPVVIFFHGYRCSAIRDGNGMFRFSKKMGYNILMIDQRAHGLSEGKTITFGIKERLDCLCWVEYLVERFGKETQILLTGISMGAATILMASDVGLPENVKGVLADCGYSSPREIIRTVIKGLHYPVGITYWMAKTGAKIFGGFDLEEASALDALKRSKLPVLLIHGDDDRFVPCAMSEACWDIGKDHIEFLKIPGAGHGLCYCVGAKVYEKAIVEFCHRVLRE